MQIESANARIEASEAPRTLGQLPFDVLHDIFEFLEWPAVRTGPARASRRLREAAHAEGFFFRLVRRDIVFAPAPATKPTNGAAVAAVTVTDRTVPSLPTARAFYCKWGPVSAHALVVPVFCPWWCDACRARVERGRGFFVFSDDDDDDDVGDAAGNACPATRIRVDGASLRCVSSSSSPVLLDPLRASPPWSPDGSAAAFATEGSLLRPSRPLAPGLVRSFERACDRVVVGGSSEHVVFVDYFAASSRFRDTVAGAMQRALWVPDEFLRLPSIVQALDGAFFSAGASSDGALLQVYVISGERIVDPFEDPNRLPDADTGSNKKAHCDPRMRMVPPARSPHPQPDPSSLPDFYVQGVRWRYAADVDDLHQLVDTASAAFMRQYTMFAYLQGIATNWVVRIAPTRAAASGGGVGKEGLSGWTCQQLRGESAPPSGALTLGYHQQPKSNATRRPGAAVDHGIETIVTCLRARVATEPPKHVPVRDSLSGMTYSAAFRRRAPLLVIPVFPDRFIGPACTGNASGDVRAHTLKALQDAARLAAMCAPEGGRGPSSFTDVT